MIHAVFSKRTGDQDVALTERASEPDCWPANDSGGIPVGWSAEAGTQTL